jgi:hypothetical protein
MLTALASLLGPLMPVLASLYFQHLKNKGIDAENQKKFLEAIQSVNALMSKNLKQHYDALYNEMKQEVKPEEKPL